MIFLMQNEEVLIKGRKSGFELILNPKAPFESILSSIEEKLSAPIFKNATATISFVGRPLSDVEFLMLKKTVLETTKGNFIFEDPFKSAGNSVFDYLNEGEDVVKFHYGTLRSGMKLTSKGSVVVVGDVNPGAEIVAAGNIIVLGTLRGVAHAGASGKVDAFIFALNLNPTQIRIADVFTRPPDDEKRRKITPEIASIKDGNVVINEVNY